MKRDAFASQLSAWRGWLLDLDELLEAWEKRAQQFAEQLKITAQRARFPGGKLALRELFDHTRGKS
jgi:hypothetical protein